MSAPDADQAGQALQAPAGEAMQALAEPAYEAARAAFEALPEANRTAIQDALVWTGDYASTADGVFGRRSFEAIQAFQRRTKRPATGVLDKAATATLLSAAARARGAAGFSVVSDQPTGIRIGLPLKLLPKRSANTAGGTRLQSKDDRVTLDTRSQPGDAEELRALYERNLAIRTPGRTITYRLQRPDFVVIAGETPGGRFYSRYAQQGETIRGFSIGYDKALSAEFDRITVAIANSFDAFPGSAAQVAGRPGLVPPTRPGTEPSLAPGRPPAAAVTGLAVGARRVVVPASIRETCPAPQVDGQPARIVSSAGGLALLETSAQRRTVPLSFAANPAEGPGAVLFFAAGEGGRPVVAPAEFTANGRLVAPLQEGASGAVAIDRSGAVAGMVGAAPSGRRAVAGLVPPASYPYIGAAELRALAGGDGEPPATATEASPSIGGAAAAILPALVAVTCPAAGGLAPPRRP
ncbi:peptidoglycan-binding domain-containing protein [Enterovirga rhinocerotis]|nr:peptidoglycan-binding domain-containing protein [Enterovirga rhinocerotis]